jgi:hypothetical protein
LTARAIRFAAVAVGMLAAHWPGDHITGQTDNQAAHKCDPGLEGAKACLAHVAAYTASTTAAVVALDKLLGLGLSTRGILAGQLISAATHYYADRDRSRLARLAAATGSPAFPKLGQPRNNLVAYVKGSDGERHHLEVVTVDQDGNEQPAPFDNPSLGTGAYAIDQSWHIGWLAVAALATAIL